MNLPVVLEVNGVVGLSTISIDTYIRHDSNAGVCFAKGSRIASASAMLFSFPPPFHTRWRVGHDYFSVLAIPATRRQLALRTNQQGADAMLVFVLFTLVKVRIHNNFA